MYELCNDLPQTTQGNAIPYPLSPVSVLHTMCISPK